MASSAADRPATTGSRKTWLFGLEGDIQGSDESADSSTMSVPSAGIASCRCGAFSRHLGQKLDWFGTARGRDRLPADRPRVVVCDRRFGLWPVLQRASPLIPVSWGATRAGWTVGAGAEAAIDQHWSVKLEYLYMDLGDVGSSSGTAITTTNALNTPRPGFNTVTTTTLTSAFHSHFHRQHRARRPQLSLRRTGGRALLSSVALSCNEKARHRAGLLIWMLLDLRDMRRSAGLVTPPCRT